MVAGLQQTEDVTFSTDRIYYPHLRIFMTGDPIFFPLVLFTPCVSTNGQPEM